MEGEKEMSYFKKKITQKALALITAMAMVFQYIPLSITVFAATDQYPGAVTLTVKDAKGNPIKDATVQFYTKTTDTDYSAGDPATTDENGTVVILPADTNFESQTWFVYAEITKDHYKTELYGTGDSPIQIVNSTEDIQITLQSTLITDVTLTAVSDLVYTGDAQNLVSVSGLKKDDKITWTVNDTVGEEIPVPDDVNSIAVPVGTEAGNYSVKLSVKRDGMELYESTVTAAIAKASITGISISGKELVYDETTKTAVELTGEPAEGDVVTWTINNESYTPTEEAPLPTVNAVGEYSITLTVDRGNNYELFTKTVKTTMLPGNIDLANLKVTGLNSVYSVDENNQPIAQKAVTVTDKAEDYTLKYQLDDGSKAPQDTLWQDEIPTVTDAGSYIVWVKAVKDSYNDEPVEVIKPQGMVAPYNVYVAKADQQIAFNSDNLNDEVTVSAAESNTYDFSATKTANLSGKDVQYELVNTTSDTAAEIAADGKLTVHKAGIVTVRAYVEGSDNYNPVEIYHTVVIDVPSDGLVTFDASSVEHTLKSSDNVDYQTANKANADDSGTITYSIDNNLLNIDPSTGAITIADRDALFAAMGTNGSVTATVTASKAIGTLAGKKYQNGEFTDITKDVYPASKTKYTVSVNYKNDTDYGAIMTLAAAGEKGWHNKDHHAVITVNEGQNYKIALDAPKDFDTTKEITQQGRNTHYVYALNTDTDEISAGYFVAPSVDTVKPSFDTATAIDYKLPDGTKVPEKDIDDKKYSYNDGNIIITFTAEDATSGIEYFDYTYTKEAGTSSSILDTYEKTVKVDSVDGTKYSASISMPADTVSQIRGYMSVVAYDKAGNVSDRVTDDGKIIVVDTIDPKFGKFIHENYITEEKDGSQYFYNGDIPISFDITEINFFPEDVNITLSKDGGEAQKIIPEWTEPETDRHVGTYTISGDGDYVVSVSYSDRSGRQIETYVSPILTIDTIKPQVKIDYIHEGDTQKTVFTVKEHNFRPVDVTLTGTMKDITGQNLTMTSDMLQTILRNNSWKNPEEDTYTFEYSSYPDGIYDLAMDYEDRSAWTAQQFKTGEFIIDHTGPDHVSIEEITNPVKKVVDEVLSKIFTFYNPDVKVRLTAYDKASGVDYFSWNYTQQDETSEINRPTDQAETKVSAVQDTTDLSKFTAEITLPDTEYKQLRGFLAATATDKFTNVSDKITEDGKIIIVDTIAPQLKIEYNTPSRTVGTKTYYDGNINAKLTVEEANFYAEDVVVKVSKNGGEAKAVTAVWKDASTDVHVGTFTISGDGHYVVSVSYTDRSGNFTENVSSYTSNEMTIDMIKPVIKVEYDNKDVVNTLKDTEAHDRKYFDDTQTATITVTEHNFNANEVDLMITAKDVSGKAVDMNKAVNISEWKVDTTGDVHTVVVTYPGDANYTFDVAYTDLATNEAADYVPDYFTVDKSIPDNLTVSYSTSILDTVLESLTFGFYNAKMTVTLTADDPTSEVHSFLYSYLNAKDVSGVNAELKEQTIGADGIKYSDDRKTATVSFEIPKMVLGSDNQFNGTVEFTATDRAGNISTSHQETKRIVVDNIAPNATVAYNDATNTVGDISYYNGNIDATITVNEANFYSDDVQIEVTRDGAAVAVTPVWRNESVDVHVGTFTLTGDGDYFVTVNYTDKSSNKMETYTSKQMTIDTDIQAPTFSINGTPRTEEGGAYKGDAVVAFNYEDQNFETKSIKLTRTRFNSVEDVTEEFITAADQDKGGSGTFTIPAEVDYDGIYLLTVEMSDKARHTVESSMKFTINRYGSVYEYDDYLMSLIKDGGQYLKLVGDNKTAVTKDLIITEYNANQILEDSLKILITRDGETIDAKYTTTPEVNGNAAIGESGWYQYRYVISKDNFDVDGVYRISLSSAYASEDSATNESSSVPDNSFDTAGSQVLDTINFVVDTTAPEIRNIVNMDQEIVNAQSLDVKYTVVDVGGLKKVEVVVNDETVDTITDFTGSEFNYTGAFTINEMNNTQTVQLIVTDIAGNITDTSSESFTTNGLYDFTGNVTVSTNAFVRWYANKPLFYGSIVGTGAVAGGVPYSIQLLKKRKLNIKNKKQS